MITLLSGQSTCFVCVYFSSLIFASCVGFSWSTNTHEPLNIVNKVLKKISMHCCPWAERRVFRAGNHSAAVGRSRELKSRWCFNGLVDGSTFSDVTPQLTSTPSHLFIDFSISSILHDASTVHCVYSDGCRFWKLPWAACWDKEPIFHLYWSQNPRSNWPPFFKLIQI